MTAQLALDPLPAPAPAAIPAHHWRGPEGAPAGTLHKCERCGRGYLDRIHQLPASRGVGAFFDALDRVDRDTTLRVRATLEERRGDLEALAASHADDARFASGLAWGIALANLVQAAMDGETEPSRLRFRDISRR